jgi:hypothetical protein
VLTDSPPAHGLASRPPGELGGEILVKRPGLTLAAAVGRPEGLRINSPGASRLMKYKWRPAADAKVK